MAKYNKGSEATLRSSVIFRFLNSMESRLVNIPMSEARGITSDLNSLVHEIAAENPNFIHEWHTHNSTGSFGNVMHAMSPSFLESLTDTSGNARVQKAAKHKR